MRAFLLTRELEQLRSGFATKLEAATTCELSDASIGFSLTTPV